MLHRKVTRLLIRNVSTCSRISTQKCFSSQSLDEKYSVTDKDKILDILNNVAIENFTDYNVTKATLKRLSQWKSNKGQVKALSEVEYIDGFTARSAKKLFDSILQGPLETKPISNKIKGQILHPNLSESVQKKCKKVLTVYITVNSVSWVLIERDSYEVTEWNYNALDYPEQKKMQITDIYDITWQVTEKLPVADIYVMKAEATSLRAAGSDPNNPKVISVNLQKSQMIAMMVALLNVRCQQSDQLDDNEENNEKVKQSVYFLRPSLPYRLYGTLVGNEKVSTDQVVEMILQEIKQKSPDQSQVYMSENLKSLFRSKDDLKKDMLGHCLLLGLTFMDICIYKNKVKIQKLIKRGD